MNLNRASHVHILTFSKKLTLNTILLPKFVDADHGSITNSIKNIIIYFLRDRPKGLMDMRRVLNFIPKFPGALTRINFCLVHIYNNFIYLAIGNINQKLINSNPIITVREVSSV